MLADEQRITAEGIAVGTPHYIAPEQARALKETDHRADLYSLGATLFHLATGRLPYEGDDGAEIMRRHVFDEVPDPRTVKPDISNELAAMILKLMAKNPAGRYQTAQDLSAEISRLLGTATPPAPASDKNEKNEAENRNSASGMPRKRFAP
jgi:serine/threonine-protein kinase